MPSAHHEFSNEYVFRQGLGGSEAEECGLPFSVLVFDVFKVQGGSIHRVPVLPHRNLMGFMGLLVGQRVIMLDTNSEPPGSGLLENRTCLDVPCGDLLITQPVFYGG